MPISQRANARTPKIEQNARQSGRKVLLVEAFQDSSQLCGNFSNLAMRKQGTHQASLAASSH